MHPALPSGTILVRQCTNCGRADLREWFASADDVPDDGWECQLCEQRGWKVRDLRSMLEGRALDIV